MKAFTVLLFVTLGCFSMCKAQEIGESSLPDTHWLIGTWKGTTGKGVFYETWRQRTDNSLICYSITINAKDTTVKENSRIRLKDNVIVFEDPDVWRAARVKKNEMTFESQNEKGSRRIIWLKTNDNHWWVILQFPSATFYYDLKSEPELDKAIDKFLPK